MTDYQPTLGSDGQPLPLIYQPDQLNENGKIDVWAYPRDLSEFAGSTEIWWQAITRKGDFFVHESTHSYETSDFRLIGYDRKRLEWAKRFGDGFKDAVEVHMIESEDELPDEVVEANKLWIAQQRGSYGKIVVPADIAGPTQYPNQIGETHDQED